VGFEGEQPKKRGFAAMSPERQREIARMGGRTVVARHPNHLSEIGKRGGRRVSRDREHMRRIGKMGGLIISEDREHMSKIGKLGWLKMNGGRRGDG